MLLLNVAIICCLFTVNLKNTASNALTIHLNNRKRDSAEISYEKRNTKKNTASNALTIHLNNRKRDSAEISYEKRNAKNSISIQFNSSPANRQFFRQATKSNTNRRPVNVSFEPLGHLKMDSLTRGQVEIDLEAVKNAVTSVTTGAISQLQKLPQYLPSLDYFQNNADDSDAESSEGRHSNNNDSAEKNYDEDDPEDSEEREVENNSESEKNQSEKDESEREDSDQQETEETDHHSREEDDDDDYSKEDDNDNKSESNQEDNSDEKNTSKNSEKKGSSETKEPEPGYLGKFQKFYSYAKPLVKAASMFVPGLGQYRQAMFALEMVDLAYETSLMYTEGKGVLSIGWFLGKEAFSRLGRRGEIEPKNIPVPVDISTEANSAEIEDFLDKVESTQYPKLDDQKEAHIRQLVSQTIDKYFHEHENLQNETQRTRFIDLMTLCVKYIALQMINDEGKSSKLN